MELRFLSPKINSGTVDIRMGRDDAAPDKKPLVFFLGVSNEASLRYDFRNHLIEPPVKSVVNGDYKLLGFNTLDAMCDFLAIHCPSWSPSFEDLARRSLDHVLLGESRAYLVEHLVRDFMHEPHMRISLITCANAQLNACDVNCAQLVHRHVAW